jgi:pimeloyl-ACP methyl ester carboxylesterase
VVTTRLELGKEMAYVKIGQSNSPIFYELSTPAEPEGTVIFINAWCSSARYWKETVKRISSRFQTLTYDQPGIGRSLSKEKPLPATYKGTIDNGSNEVLELVEHLQLLDKPVHVVGHSLGVVIATHLATLLESRGKLASLTIINCGSFEIEDRKGEILIPFIKLVVNVKRILELPGLRQLTIRKLTARPIESSYEQIIINDMVASDIRIARELALSSLTPINLERYHHEVGALKAPLLLVVGDRDGTIPTKGMYNIKRFKPTANLVPFPDCGHFLMLERPNRFAEVLLQHLSLKVISIR